MTQPLYFLNPEDPEWDKAWSAFPDPEMYNEEHGERLQYMGSYHRPTGYVHEFRHRAWPGANQRQLFHIPCTPGWRPREGTMQNTWSAYAHRSIRMAPLPAGLTRYAVVSRDNPTIIFVTIVAATPESAWRKFCTQHFGALKPGRAEYCIRAQTAEEE